ncbi:MAG: hypothetical protein IJ968_03080 [Clostridia bacterium]|nr:hypothetical protein [Clostridia bacterium]
MKKGLLFFLIAVQLVIAPWALADVSMMMYPAFDEELSATSLEMMMVEGDDFLVVPKLSDGVGQADVINAAVREKAQIAAYENIMTYGTGSAGLQVFPDMMMQKGNVYSVAVSANGKMPVGRPSQVYYPMTFDITTGEEIPFEALFADADGAMAYMEAKVEGMEENLSTHLENRQLLPVPFDRYTIDEYGNMIIWYERDQLSFLSGFSGSVYFRFSELEPYYDLTEGSYLHGILSDKPQAGFMNGLGNRFCLGNEMQTALTRFRSTIDSEYYPGGACYEVEDAVLQGALLLTDESEEIVRGILVSNLDDNGICTGKTTLDEAQTLLGADGIPMAFDADTAAEYRVCSGTSLTYRREMAVCFEKQMVAYTLYADDNGVIQYIKIALEQ